jgi:hypothetical protein
MESYIFVGSLYSEYANVGKSAGEYQCEKRRISGGKFLTQCFSVCYEGHSEVGTLLV